VGSTVLHGAVRFGARGLRCMAGLRINNQKMQSPGAMIIVTAFKICISHRKNGFLNRPNAQLSFPTFLVDFT
jgi:hypothetical protein